MQTIYLDISNKGIFPAIYAKQGDVGRRFEIVFTNSGLPYAPPNGSAFSVWYSGESGEGNYTDIDDRSAFSVNGNKVAVEMISQMLTNYGNGILCLVLNESNGNQIGSWNIPYICEKVPGLDSEEAKSYYTAFSKAVESLPYPDASLSVAGKAADAAAVGTAIAGITPAKIGAATAANAVSWKDPTLNSNTDFDTVTGIGIYWCNTWGGADTGKNLPNGKDTGWLVVYGSSDRLVVQEYYALHGERLRRSWSATGVATAWDWLNPSMILNTEYRTIERYQGKAVYTMLVDLGELPNTAQKTKYFADGVTKVVRCNGQTSDKYAIPYYAFGSRIDITATNWGIVVNTSFDASAITATAQVWYLKD